MMMMIANSSQTFPEELHVYLFIYLFIYFRQHGP